MAKKTTKKSKATGNDNAAKAKKLGITFGQRINNLDNPTMHGKTYYAERPTSVPEGAVVKSVYAIGSTKFDPPIFAVRVPEAKVPQSKPSTAKGTKARAARASKDGATWKERVMARESTQELVAKINKHTSAKPLRATALDAKYELRLAKIAASVGAVKMEKRDDTVVFFAK
ncbi:MAG: hypothetical protein V7638_3870 [Acidobacteriota bacterium]|jgi:hypothetical protein